MSNPFYDPSKKIHFRTGDEAYEGYLARVKSESKKGNQDNKSKKSQATIPLKVPSNFNDAESYLILPGRVITKDYSYPDLLVSMEKSYHNNTWHEAHEELHKEDSFMLTIRQYVDFINLLKSGKAHNGKGNSVDKATLDKILDEILTVRSPWRSEWLDAKFSKKTSGILNRSEQWYIDYHKINNGNLEEVTEKLDECLMNDKTPGISLDSWLSNATTQGLPSKDIPNGDLYYWNPRDKTVAGLDADSDGASLDCYGGPGVSVAGRGVRRTKILK